jgi:uncharacterized membrane protein YoaK (UPF0700 family)
VDVLRMLSRDGVARCLLTLLAMTSGAADAMAFLAAGKVFSSVMTGNLVLLGIAAGSRAARLAASAAVALAGYCAGVIAGTLIAGQAAEGEQRAWSPRATAALAAEFALLGGYCAGWELAGGQLGEAKLPLLVLLAVAMGMQSAAIIRVGRLSTTYLTGVLTSALIAVAGRRRPAETGSFPVLAGVVAGAAGLAATLSYAPDLAPLPLLVPLTVVVLLASASRRPQRRPPRPAAPPPT